MNETIFSMIRTDSGGYRDPRHPGGSELRHSDGIPEVVDIRAVDAVSISVGVEAQERRIVSRILLATSQSVTRPARV